MSDHENGHRRPRASKPPDRPMAVLVMLAEDDDRVVLIDLSTHPCGQQIVDDYAAGAELVSADHLADQPLGTAASPVRPV